MGTISTISATYQPHENSFAELFEYGEAVQTSPSSHCIQGDSHTVAHTAHTVALRIRFMAPQCNFSRSMTNRYSPVYIAVIFVKLSFSSNYWYPFLLHHPDSTPPNGWTVAEMYQPLYDCNLWHEIAVLIYTVSLIEKGLHFMLRFFVSLYQHLICCAFEPIIQTSFNFNPIINK